MEFATNIDESENAPLISEGDVSYPNYGDLSLIDQFLFGEEAYNTITNNEIESPAAVSAGQFAIEYLLWRDTVTKKQRRVRREPKMQRIDPQESQIQLAITFNEENVFSNFFHLMLKVQREPFIGSPGTQQFYMEPFELEVKAENIEFLQDNRTITVKADLDSAYIVDEHKVYELSKSKPEERNNFRVVVEIYFRDGSNSRQHTKSFYLLGKRDGKRKRDETEESTVVQTEIETDQFLSVSGYPIPSPNSDIARLVAPASLQPPSSTGQQTFSSGSSPPPSSIGQETFSSRSSPDSVNARQKFQLLEAESIDANIAKIKTLFVGHRIMTSNGDIAYHFRIRDTAGGVCEEFTEAEIVGFVTGEDGIIELVKSTAQNGSKIFMKGVITRKMFLGAMLPTDNSSGRYETIAFSGIVPVRTIGPVRPMDGLFSSETMPGCATANPNLAKLTYEPVLIGTCIDERLDVAVNEIHTPQATVSFHSQAGQILAQNMIKKQLVSQAELQSREGRRQSMTVIVLLVVMATLAFVLFYQLFQPGSALKKWQCARHRVGDNHQAFFWHDYNDKRKKLLEFSFANLWAKISLSHRPKIDESDYRFYLNIARCADPSNKSLGPKLVAIDRCCTRMYELNNYLEWVRDCQVCWEPKCDLECLPNFEFESRHAHSNCNRSIVMCPDCRVHPIFLNQLPNISKIYTSECKRKPAVFMLSV